MTTIYLSPFESKNESGVNRCRRLARNWAKMRAHINNNINQEYLRQEPYILDTPNMKEILKGKRIYYQPRPDRLNIKDFSSSFTRSAIQYKNGALGLVSNNPHLQLYIFSYLENDIHASAKFI